MPFKYNQEEFQHTEEMNDIITAAPSWLLLWRITLFFSVLVLIVGMAAIIRYPDIVKTQLKINSGNSPKPIIAKASGKLVRLLVQENEIVRTGQRLAYIESTAKHEHVLRLLENTKKLQEELYAGKSDGLKFLENPGILQLGEVQAAYQAFFQSYLLFRSALADGFYLKKKAYLYKDLEAIKRQKTQLSIQKLIQEKEYKFAEHEYSIYQKLTAQNVMAQMELRREESKLLSKKYPLQQTEYAFIANAASLSAKEKELMEQDNQIREEKSGFVQALRSFISELDLWKSKYVLTASQRGELGFAGIIQENQVVNAGEEIFYVDPGKNDFFGEMAIPEYNMGKVSEGQEVLIKLRSFPYEEYGILRGNISYIADLPYRDSVFVSKVILNKNSFSGLKRPLMLRNGMTATAEIITEDATLLSRLFRSFNKIIE